jgi:putative membrane protein
VSADSTRREGTGAAPGGDRVGRGVQPPQAEIRADEDATVKSASIAYRAVTGEEPDREAKRWLGSAMHYAFGAGVGLTYGLVAARASWIRAGHGTFYGALVWAIADEGIMPALGLSRGPGELSRGVLAYGLGGHFVFGAVLDSVLGLGTRA